MGDRIVVMRGGRIQQVGSPTELYDQPQNAYVASFIGSPPMNFLHGRVEGDGVALTEERTALTFNGAARAALARAEGGEVTIGVRPEHIQSSPTGRPKAACSASPALSTRSNRSATRRWSGRRWRRTSG